MIEMADLGDGRYARGVAGDTLNTAWYARHALPADWRELRMSTVISGHALGD